VGGVAVAVAAECEVWKTILEKVEMKMSFSVPNRYAVSVVSQRGCSVNG